MVWASYQAVYLDAFLRRLGLGDRPVVVSVLAESAGGITYRSLAQPAQAAATGPDPDKQKIRIDWWTD